MHCWEQVQVEERKHILQFLNDYIYNAGTDVSKSLSVSVIRRTVKAGYPIPG